MKHHIKKIIERDNDCLVSELEYRIGNRVADYYFEKKDKRGNIVKIAVECVFRHDDLEDFQAKNEDYIKHGVYVSWIFDGNRFIAGYRTRNDLPIHEKTIFKNEFGIKSIHKEAHKMYFGKIFILNRYDNTMWAMHFNDVTRWVEEKVIIDWDSFNEDREIEGWVDIENYQKVVGGYEKKLPSKRSPSVYYIPKFELTVSKKNPDKFCSYKRMIAQVFIKSWWKATA